MSTDPSDDIKSPLGAEVPVVTEDSMVAIPRGVQNPQESSERPVEIVEDAPQASSLSDEVPQVSDTG